MSLSPDTDTTDRQPMDCSIEDTHAEAMVAAAAETPAIPEHGTPSSTSGQAHAT